MSAAPQLPEHTHRVSEQAPEAAAKQLQNRASSTHVEEIHSNGVAGVKTANGDRNRMATDIHNDADRFEMHATPIENFRPVKVIVIGAGYSGIYHGIRIPERIQNCELVIYEKNAGVGGTWYELESS